ncbi:MAG: tRNA (N6-isopentenyl adenosine(37)-C2)-methylthiotransferase MiaB [Candidatus Krumholzibacteria bacterium]|nr:tRNA (N6-isopentenyl adenosine(37)-C2)-methylthiotransferase MiaB [Candidatus Krumholzibacteria bacterium]
MKELRIYYESFGCQMNAFDTEVIASMMFKDGFGTASRPENADVIIVNTCSVREHAEKRAIGRLTELSRHRDAVLAVCGCMAQRLGKELFDLVPGLSIVAGTDSYKRLPTTIVDALETGGRFSLLDRDDRVTYSLMPAVFHGPASRYLSITRGCENYCSYCIVPYLRGKLRSKDPDKIINEANSMVKAGAKEVTLLGQNVMAYRFGNVDFVTLLKRVVDETELFRVRFLTTHPRDATDEIFNLMAEQERVCPHIHLPIQAGSNRILRIMKRGYTREQYLAAVNRSRKILPGLAITTDIIVGFPTETDDEFKETIELVNEVRYDAAFTFKYSPRKGTAAAGLGNDIPLEVKKERLRILNNRIREIRAEILMDQIGSETEILLDGPVQKGEYQFYKGRTPHFRNVLIPDNHLEEGEIVSVRLDRIWNFTFVGEKLARR